VLEPLCKWLKTRPWRSEVALTPSRRGQGSNGWQARSNGRTTSPTPGRTRLAGSEGRRFVYAEPGWAIQEGNPDYTHLPSVAAWNVLSPPSVHRRIAIPAFGRDLYVNKRKARGWERMKAILPTLLVVILGAAPLWAALGGYESSVNLDQQVLRGVDREEARQGYKLHQITSADGTVVKEFISPAGLVFEVAWQGSHMPNLQQLLGASMNDLLVALQSKTLRNARAPLIVRTDRLVFVSAGHMRSFHGYAYVPRLVPDKLNPEVAQ